MDQVICPNYASNPLPTYHLAILFEGAWIFSPGSDDGTKILATCPIASTDHDCVFGVWDGGKQTIEPIGGLSTNMPLGSAFTVTINGTSVPNDYSGAFNDAAAKYPFGYISPV